MQRISPSRLMNTLFFGLAMSAVYGALSAGILFFVGGVAEVQAFLNAYTTTFKTLFSFGLVAGTALIVFRSQAVIPETIENAFTHPQLVKTKYLFYKKRFESRRRSMTFAADFVVVSFAIFTSCGFPLHKTGSTIMLIAACAQYGLAVYVGRKLFYVGMMLHSLLEAPVTRNLFKAGELDEINV